MRLAIAALALSAVSIAARAEAPADAIAIGPWKVDAVLKGQKFDRCTMTRTTDDGVEVRFTRDAAGLDLTMSSAKWRLGRGKSYPVELVAGSSTLQADVAASGNAVSLPVKDERFLKSLKLADGLDVKGEGATIKVALDKSAAALDRLEECDAKNGSAAERNPFVAPSGKP
ncbi:hypothetical protein [Methylobacterium sp. A52T]